MANSHIEGKAEEYSSKRAWSTIDKQYPEGKAERNPGNKQKVRNQTARQHKKTRLNTNKTHKTKQNKTKQNKTKQNKTKQNKTKQNTGRLGRS